MTADDVEFGEIKVMGIILNPTIENSFVSLANRKDRYLFVDKSDFIEITNKRLNEDDRFMGL